MLRSCVRTRCVRREFFCVFLAISLFFFCDAWLLARRRSTPPLAVVHLPLRHQAAGPRWYMSANEGRYAANVGVALASAAAYSDVSPRFIRAVVGWASPRLEAIVMRAGTPVIVHDVRYMSALKAAAAKLFPKDLQAPSVAVGTFVRLDIAVLAAAETLNETADWVFLHLEEAAERMAAFPLDDVVLYTDTDVVFEPGALLGAALASGELSTPAVFAAASELNVTDYDALNSGVLLLRVSGFLRVYDMLWADMGRTGFVCMQAAWDQGCLREFARAHGLMAAPAARLPPSWHWRPYLRWPDDALPRGAPTRLVHFHGPKPLHLVRFVLDPHVLEGLPIDHPWFPPEYRDMWARNPAGFIWALSRWVMHANVLAGV
jgi:hypothetical protein